MYVYAKERLLAIVVAALVIAVTVFGATYQGRTDGRLLAQSHKGRVHIYHITGIAKPGMWTLDQVEGYNYWWRRPHKLKELKVRKGDTVVLVLTSADVDHGFLIPALNLGPYDIYPGHRKVVRFVADRAGSFPFMCARVCSCTGNGFACTLTKKQGHEGMTGVLTVEEPLGPPNVRVAVTVTDEKGFEPATIHVKKNDIVQVTVTSHSNGKGDGVGFCITEYETKVDLQGIAAGDSRTFKFRADKPGSFMIYSSTKAGPKIDNAMGTFIVDDKAR